MGGGTAHFGQRGKKPPKLKKKWLKNLVPMDLEARRGAMPMSLGNTFSQDVPIGCPGTSPLDVLGHPYVMSWNISM